MLFLGIDAGTQGVRAVAVEPSGQTIAEGSYRYPTLNLADPADGPDRYEQSPEDWWNALRDAIGACAACLREKGRSPDEIAALSACGTSGTVLPIDSGGSAIAPAILYNDLRSAGIAARMKDLAPGLEEKLGYRIGVSFSLPRLLWYKEHQPRLYEGCGKFIHQTDYLLGRLCGEYVTDYTNAQKSGYDAAQMEWPEELKRCLGLDPEKLPRVLAPGEAIGAILPEAARELGLPETVTVCAGATDAYAAVLATGAVEPGDCISVLGTTLVCKAVAPRRITDPAGVGYPYRMPGEKWLVGGATNLGGRCIGEIAGGDYARLDAEALGMIPTGVRCYPLYGKGERFPFSDPEAEPFFRGNLFGGRLYPALMEGEAYGERLCYERIGELGCPAGDVVRATGGASRSGVWLKIRASVLGKRMEVPEVLTSAMGSAMMAAAGMMGGLEQAARGMVRMRLTVEPDPVLAKAYDELYGQFREECRREYGI